MKKTIKYLVIALAILVNSSKLHAQVSIGISVHINPPAMPVYSQPACPADGYIWTPGYWAWSDIDNDYYWVPGVWVSPPRTGYLWTPGYWGYDGDVYVFHSGYWGRHIGFYGGVNYGYGYGGSGFYGGRWEGGSFRYNTAVVNVNTTIVHNTYIDRTVIVNNTTVNNHTSFNGPGGVAAKPRPEEVKAMNESHIQATAFQQSHDKVARSNRSQFAGANDGKPSDNANRGSSKLAERETGDKKPSMQHAGNPDAKPAEHAEINKQQAYNRMPATHKSAAHHKAKPADKQAEKHRG